MEGTQETSTKCMTVCVCTAFFPHFNWIWEHIKFLLLPCIHPLYNFYSLSSSSTVHPPDQTLRNRDGHKKKIIIKLYEDTRKKNQGLTFTGLHVSLLNNVVTRQCGHPYDQVDVVCPRIQHCVCQAKRLILFKLVNCDDDAARGI